MAAKTPCLRPPNQIEQKPHAVGYGKPPQATRFKPGVSGNPKGRPKGARNKQSDLGQERLKEIILAEAYRTISIKEGAREISLPMAAAVLRAVAINAVKGQHRSQKLFTELVGQTEAANKADHDRMLELALDYKARWEKAIMQAQAQGLPEPDPVPHPRDISINPNSGVVTFNGPITREQREIGHKLITRFEGSDKEVKVLEEIRRETRNPDTRAKVDEEIAREYQLRAELLDVIMNTKWLREEWVRRRKEKRT